MCYGHFNVIHPGHIQYLEHSKKFGNKLLIAVKEFEISESEKSEVVLNVLKKIMKFENTKKNKKDIA